MDDESSSAEGVEAAREDQGWKIVRFDALKNPPVWLAASIYVLAALFALAVLALVGFGLFASFHVAYETAVGEFKDRIEAAKVFFPILLALVGGPLLIWRVVTAHMQAKAAGRQADIAQEGFFTSLFTKAVEQLGATREVKGYKEVEDDGGHKRQEAVNTTEPNLEVRLGAIYALDRVARDSERDHWPIMEVLCAYTRNPQNSNIPVPTPKEYPGPKLGVWSRSLGAPRVDVQAALTVIGQRTDRGRFFESKRDLRLDLRRSNLQKAVLMHGIFDRAQFDAAHLDSASFRKAHVKDASFGGAFLVAASFVDAVMTGASFDGAKLWRASFTGAKLSETSFFHADLNRANFNRSDLTSATFYDSNLSNATFRQATLFKASFYESQLKGASFKDASLTGAVFFDTDLSETQGLDASELSHTFGDTTTILPDTIPRPGTWPDRELSWEERSEWLKNREFPSVQAIDGKVRGAHVR